MSQEKYTFEVCANSVESCLAAQAGGAHRVELCAGIPEGGTTPSYGEIAIARKKLDIKLNVIIRPRGGDFLYSNTELETMLADIDMMHSLHVDGIVAGALTAEGDIDIDVMQRIMAHAGSIPVTFHRAFDRCRQPLEALHQLIDLGVSRLLTSGLQPTALQGASMIKQLVELANGRIAIMAGCGVNEGNIAQIARETGAREFHFSAREPINSNMLIRNTEVKMGNADEDEYTRMITTQRRVKNTIQALLLNKK